LGEQVQFDVVTVAYILPLVFLVLENGGFAPKRSEEADEQLVLTLEFLSLHSEICEFIGYHRILLILRCQ
jgi:hypothetical protein